MDSVKDEQLEVQLVQEIQALLQQGKPMLALPMIRQGAHWGNRDLQILAKEMYLHGLYGTPVNDQGAFEYARLAAFNQDARSMADLAKMFAYGKGTNKDEAAAFYYLKKAADLFEPSAFGQLALAYAKGTGTPVNTALARKYLAMAEKYDADNPDLPRIAKLVTLLCEKAEARKDA